MYVDEKGVIPAEELMVNQVVAQFEKDFDCEVEMVSMSDDLYQMFLAAGLAQDGPDLCTLWTGAYTTDYAVYIEGKVLSEMRAIVESLYQETKAVGA